MRRTATFSDIYQRHIRAGDDPACALYAAEEWQKRQGRKQRMSTRAKFTVIEHKQSMGSVRNLETGKYGMGVWHAVVLQAVSSGSPENERFYAATPNGRIEMAMVSADAAARFPIGAEVYVDFTVVEREA